MHLTSSCFLFHQNKSSFQEMWCSQPLLCASKPSPEFPQVLSHPTTLLLFLLFFSAPLWPLLSSPSTPMSDLHSVLVLLWVPLQFLTQIFNPINLLKILLWLKCIYSQRLLFFLSWLWSFSSGVTNIATAVPWSPWVRGCEVPCALLHCLAGDIKLSAAQLFPGHCVWYGSPKP